MQRTALLGVTLRLSFLDLSIFHLRSRDSSFSSSFSLLHIDVYVECFDSEPRYPDLIYSIQTCDLTEHADAC